ncbi:MAG TPA: Rrf2 family transcriptional regulator [Nitrospirota bacterium]|nr:Rrf2 family transcriptional regulator [Nitrospirota bacterium]
MTMLVTRETDYAIRTILYLAKERGHIVSATKIARAIHIPRSFLSKILQRLVRSRILTSLRGVNGGFRLARTPSRISLLSIMEAVQGLTCINACAIDSTACKLSRTCTVHSVWVKMRTEMERRLQKETVAKLM